MVHMQPTICPSQIDFEDLWYTYDTDRSGTMDPQEIQNMLSDICKTVEKVDREKLMVMGKNLPDSPQSAAVFTAMLNAHVAVSNLIASRTGEEGVEFAMWLFDKDGDGFVTKDEFLEKAQEVLFGEDSTLISADEIQEIQV